MRLFVAAEVAPAAIDAAQRTIAELKTRAATLAPDARITWIPSPLMHLTVRFIGSVPEAEVPSISALLKKAIDLNPFDLTLSGIGTFPDRGTPRVIWAGISAGVDELVKVEVEVSARLQQAGIPQDDRIFSPHLTLGRVREGAGLRSSSLLAGLDELELGTTRVEAITLFESRLSPKGPTYVPLQRTPLWKKPSLS